MNSSEIATGPFIMKTPLLSTYSQQLWVIAKLLTSNNDGNIYTIVTIFIVIIYNYNSNFIDERYDKSFQVTISIDGIAIDHKLISVLSSETGHNRYVYDIYIVIVRI